MNKPVLTTSDVKSQVGVWMRVVSNNLSHAIAAKLFNNSVTIAEWVVLREMYDHKLIAPSVLANLTGMTRAAASRLVDRLVAKKLVRRRKRRADDRRFQEILLTPGGRRLITKLAALAEEIDAEYFATLSPYERQILVAMLKKLAWAHDVCKLPTQ